jgi:hypothetical protein
MGDRSNPCAPLIYVQYVTNLNFVTICYAFYMKCPNKCSHFDPEKKASELSLRHGNTENKAY